MDKPKKVIYPDWIKAIGKGQNGKFCMYVVKVETHTEVFEPVGHYFKFGITSAIHDRIRKHFRDFVARTENFGSGFIIEPCALIDCGSDAVMKRVESEFKNEAAKSGILRNRYDKTEIIYVPGHVDNVRNYIGWIHERVASLHKDPEFAKEVDASIKLKELQKKEKLEIINFSAAVQADRNVTLVNLEELRIEFRQEVDKLRLLYRMEIERLESRVRELELTVNRSTADRSTADRSTIKTNH